MKFLLVTTLNKLVNKVWCCEETSAVGSLLPPVDLASIAAVLKSLGQEVIIVDPRLAPYGQALLNEKINNFQPDFIVINIATPFARQDYALLREIKGPLKLAFGPHASALPEDCRQNGIDYVLVGDPEQGIIDFVSGGFKLPEESIFRQCRDLDSLPFPALELLELRKYKTPYIQKLPFTCLLSSRGCPFRCSFCVYPVLFGQNVRRQSVARMIAEIEYNQKHFGIKEFMYLDAMFNLSEERVLEFCQAISRKKLRLKWSCDFRVEPVTVEMLKVMKRTGCYRIFYGVEDPALYSDIGKKTTWEKTQRAFKLTREAGIEAVAFVMLFPDRKLPLNDYRKYMLDLLNELRADGLQCSMFIPLPGTDAFREMKQGERLSYDWDCYDPAGARLPYNTSVDLAAVKKGVYLRYLQAHPFKTLKQLSRLRPGQLYSVWQFIKLL